MLAQNQTSASELLTHTTIRIEGDLEDNKTSVGTGFFFNFKNGDKSIPVIITNKHVVEDCHNLRFTFNESDVKKSRINEKHLNATMDENTMKKMIISHPEIDVDLCAIPVAPVINTLAKQGKSLYLKWLDAEYIPSQTDWTSFSAIEEITMIGYPNGIWDKVNNLPVARRGITATHPRIDYDGKSEFLIDTAVYPGSSGSPIYLFNQGSYATDKGITMGTRLKLLGINYAVYTHTAEGNITIKKTPTTSKPITKIVLPNNLGVIIKSTKILDFQPLLQQKI